MVWLRETKYRSRAWNMADDFSSLEVLLKATSKVQVSELCDQVYLHRNNVPRQVVLGIAESFGVSVQEGEKLCAALLKLIKSALFEGCMDASSVAALFPADFHGNLKKLLSDIISRNIAQWRAATIENQTSLPKLQEFDWRIDVKTSSDTISRMSAPTCLLQLKVQNRPTDRNDMSLADNVTVELSKETLDTMLDSLGVIRDQLASVAKSHT